MQGMSADSSPSPPRRGVANLASLPLRRGPDAREIQGNVLAAFNKPQMAFLLVSLPEDHDRARAWLWELEPLVASTEEVEDSNESRRGKGPDLEGIAATWTAIGLTWTGLCALAPSLGLERDLAEHWAFRVGPAERARDLGDVDRNAPSEWYFGAPSHARVDAVVTLAADEKADLRERRDAISELGRRHGAFTVFEQEGAKLSGGSEHFGFRDGISQPEVEGFHRPSPENQHERDGYPGTWLVKPGEFVLGWPAEDGDPADVPPWLHNASFQVLRRLDQDVAGWRAQAERASADPKKQELWAAGLVGRLPSGEPLAAPGGGICNAFDYADDPDGKRTARNAHIRKVFPRNDARFPAGPSGVREPQRRRLIRRGIPFGAPFDAERPGGKRGLVFNAFMASIERQFEYVQRNWANKPDFPEDGDGPDWVIGGKDPVAEVAGGYHPSRLASSTGGGGEPPRLPRFVQTRGALYALALSKRTLAWLAKDPAATPPAAKAPS